MIVRRSRAQIVVVLVLDVLEGHTFRLSGGARTAPLPQRSSNIEDEDDDEDEDD
jgi:hypothetical protein